MQRLVGLVPRAFGDNGDAYATLRRRFHQILRSVNINAEVSSEWG
jgi:hypothetical protein